MPNFPLMAVLANLTSLAFAIGAIILALHGVEGWSWLVFAAVMSHSYTS